MRKINQKHRAHRVSQMNEERVRALGSEARSKYSKQSPLSAIHKWMESAPAMQPGRRMGTLQSAFTHLKATRK